MTLEENAAFERLLDMCYKFPIEEQLLAWIDVVNVHGQGRFRSWLLSTDEMGIYVRKSIYRSYGQDYTVLNLANIQVRRDYQGRGLFTAFLDFALRNAPWDGVRVECVHNPRLAAWLLRRGWVRDPRTSDRNPDFYLWTCEAPEMEPPSDAERASWEDPFAFILSEGAE